MSTYLEDLKKTDPEKYADLKLVGNQPKYCLQNMVKALSMHEALNTPEENARLAAAKRLLKGRYGVKK